MQPGETITPGGAPAPSAQPPTPPTPAPTPEPAPQPAAPLPPAPTPEPETAPASAPVQDEGDAISWTASEFLIHQKDFNWYAMLALGTVLVGGLVALITRDKISVGVVAILGIVFGISAARQPRTLQYRIDEAGIHMGPKSYAYEEFKFFSIVEEGPIHSIMLMPLKRFMPGVTLYYPPEQEAAIGEVLSLYLPHEERKPDMVDRLMHKVRF